MPAGPDLVFLPLLLLLLRAACQAVMSVKSQSQMLHCTFCQKDREEAAGKYNLVGRELIKIYIFRWVSVFLITWITGILFCNSACMILIGIVYV
jgi:hypothetical protein